jgi:predicted transcriptional regulator of viral defense system
VVCLPSKLKQAKPDIVAFFHLSGKKIFTYSELSDILARNREMAAIPISLYPQLSQISVENKLIKIEEIEFPSRTFVKYIWGRVSIYNLLLSFHRNSYFSHHTAMHFHKLTQLIPQTIYLNVEQRLKFRDESATLLQENIDKAFKQRQRTTTNISTYINHKIFLLNGMHTGNLGVEELDFPGTKNCRLTGLERTLIDVAVRPVYSGGVSEVLEAYRLARKKVSAKKLISLLQKLDYIYPYHQAIGFYMQRAGYDDSALKLIRESGPIEYAFYLTHEMKKTDYSEEWRLYFPKGL